MRKLNLKSLIGVALQNWGSDASWEAINELRMRGSPETLLAVTKLSQSHNWRKRALGLEIASQLRQRSTTKPLGSIEYALEATQSLLFQGLHDGHTEVINAAICGLGHRPLKEALTQLIQFANHRSEVIRFNAAFALASYEDPKAITALLALAADPSNDVRNWATFGIGSLSDADSTEIRQILWLNVHDKDDQVRGEALVGLAKRKDKQIIPVLLERLNERCRVFELEAAELMADAELLPNLELIKASILDHEETDVFWYQSLLEAIDACQRHSSN